MQAFLELNRKTLWMI